MVTKSQIKNIRRLHLKKYRTADGLFIAEGDKTVREFLAAGFEPELLVCVQAWMDKNRATLEEAGVKAEVAAPDVLVQLSGLQSAVSVMAVFHKPVWKINRERVMSGWNLALDGVSDPGNMGTLIRTADWFGVQYIFCSPGCVDSFNAKVVQSSMGSVARVEVHPVELKELFEEYADLPLFGAQLRGEFPERDSLPSAGFLLLGSESAGISPSLERYIQTSVRIPRFGGAESLNVAVAAAVLLAWIKIDA